MEWPLIKNSAANYFGDTHLVRGIGPDDILKLSTDSQTMYIGPIDWTWGNDDPEIAKKLKDIETIYDLRCNQVEILMAEAGMLIERALGDTLKFDDLNLERFKVLMEFIEYFKTRDQQLIEQADKDYWNGLINEADFAAQGRTHLSDNSPAISNQYTFTVARYNEAAANATAPGQEVARQNAAAGSSSTATALMQYNVGLAANKSDGDSHAARKNYEVRARVNQVARQAITQEIVGIKLNEMQKPGGALNYNARMLEIGERAFNDFLEVNARLNAIALGLSEFYSVTDPSQADIDEYFKKSRTRVEGAVKWLRRAANAFARARMEEQQCVVRLTIEPNVKNGLLKELQQGRIIQFPLDLVAKMTRAQLRGISATAEGISGDAWIDLEAISPEQRLSQITLPSVRVRLGRVSSSASLNVRDVVGGRPITNRSPVGEWTVSAKRNDRAKSVSRLHLDFHLAFCAG